MADVVYRGLRVAAAVGAAVLLTTAAQAQNARTSNCQSQLGPGGWNTTCTSVSAPAPEAPFQRGAATETVVKVAPASTGTTSTGTPGSGAAAEKPSGAPARISSEFCRPPLRMTERDGCQPR